ncbi:hypothetical protein AALA52_06940 [Lactococcus ileimucosae]|uniref:DUF443 family protein n=1 Tax=Lactococcus ileimucosae TaxID=2941329 RepID=A0ABV4D6E8_9LACT
MVVMPLTRVWFLLVEVNYRRASNGKFTEPKDIFAEYDFLKKELVWKQWDDSQTTKNNAWIYKILLLAPISSPLIMVPITNFMGATSQIELTARERIGDFWWLFPIIFGIVMFLSFDMYMLNIRQNTIIIEAPREVDIPGYFKATTIGEKGNPRHKRPKELLFPWGEYVAAVGMTLAFLGVMYFVLLHPWNFVTFIAQVFVTSIIIAASLWYAWVMIIARPFVIKKVFKELNGK